MKLLTTILFVLIVIYSCKNSDPKKELSEREKQEELYAIADAQLSGQQEKIALLSSIKRVSYDTLYLIIRDYYSKTSDNINSPDSSRFFCEKAIDYISQNYHVSKTKVASLIFSFKYEMLSKDEIIETEMERSESERASEQESNDNYPY